MLHFSGFTTVGIFLVEFIEYFGTSKLYASWIGSVMNAVIAIAGSSKMGSYAPVIETRVGNTRGPSFLARNVDGI